jgi:hypothetical protein
LNNWTAKLLSDLEYAGRGKTRPAGGAPGGTPFPVVRGGKDYGELLIVTDLEGADGRRALGELLGLGRLGFRLAALAPFCAEVLKAAARELEVYRAYAPEMLEGKTAVVVKASAAFLAGCALGTERYALAVLDALDRGIPVLAEFPFPLEGKGAKIYRPCIEVLRSLGVRPVKRGGFVEALISGPRLSQAGTREARVGASPIITAKDATEYSGGKEWILPAGAKLTDLAREKAEERGIVIKRTR